MTIPPITVRPEQDNLVTNPVAATNTTGWATGGNRTLSRTDSLPTTVGLPDGVTTGFMATANTSFVNVVGVAWDAITVPEPGTYTQSIYLYIPVTWAGGGVFLSDLAGPFGPGIVRAPADMDRTGEWQQITATFAVTDDLSGSICLSVEGGWVSGDSLTFTAALMVKSTSADPFAIGTRPGIRLPGFMTHGQPGPIHWR